MSGSDTDCRHRAFVALGSNIDPEQHLLAAVRSLRSIGEVAAVSRVFESPPVDGSNQPNYLNAAVLLLTEASAHELCCDLLPQIEQELGRVRDPDNRYAARTIDLDLALYDDDILTIGHRRIPDPEIEDRPFLAVPLSEVDGEFKHPLTQLTLQQIATRHWERNGLLLRNDVQLSMF